MAVKPSGQVERTVQTALLPQNIPIVTCHFLRLGEECDTMNQSYAERVKGAGSLSTSSGLQEEARQQQFRPHNFFIGSPKPQSLP